MTATRSLAAGVALHKALDQAVKWHMIPRNVAEVVKAPRPAPEEIRPLNREQTKALLEVAKGEEDRFEALYMLAVTTGLRQGEILGLKWDDVDFQDGVVRVRCTLTRHKGRLVLGEPKTKRSLRTVQLTEAAVEALEGHFGRDGAEGLSRRPLRRPGPRLCYPEGDAGEPYQPQKAVLRAAPREGRTSGHPVSRPSAYLRDAAPVEKRKPQDRLGDAGTRYHRHNPRYLLPCAP